MTGKIFVGTASWTDPGFVADWYPKGLPASERLAWYADHFNFVELNSSFYAIPNQKQVEHWCRQTPDGFVFDVKLHRLLSRHSTAINTLPPNLRRRAEIKSGKVTLTPALEKAVAERFLEEIAPLQRHHKLGALLLQLSPSFSPRFHHLPELDDLLECLRGYRIAVELRNRGWLSEECAKQTEGFFRSRQLSFVCVDAPAEPHFMIMPSIDLVTHDQLAYFRVHGRNARGYVSGRTVAERFNYQYSDEELQEVAERAVSLARQAAQLHVVFNNNAQDYAPRDAARLLKVLMKRLPEAARQLSLPASFQGSGSRERILKQQTLCFDKL